MSGTTPSAVIARDKDVGGHVITSATSKPSYFRGDNSCPDGDVIGGLRSNVLPGGSVLLTWTEPGSIHEFVVELDRYDVTNVFLPVPVSSVKGPLLKLHLESEGRYRFRVREQNDCGGLGPWSAYEFFSTEINDQVYDPIVVTPPVVVPPVIVPPVVVPPVVIPPVIDSCPNGDHNNDGHCDSGNPPENPGGGNGNDNGNGNPPVDPGNGGGSGNPNPSGGDNGNSCTIHTQGKPVTPPGQSDGGNGNGGGNAGGPPDADHNDDGHNDCGVGPNRLR
jgi:hypothetical protein